MNPNDSGARPDSAKLPDSLRWLADAPLFIDAKLVDGFYDAVVQPQNEEMTTTLEVSQDTMRELDTKFDVGASVSPSELLTSLSHFLPFLKVEAHADAEVVSKQGSTNSKSQRIELRAIKTPQRQLVNLVLHYLINQPSRLYLKGDPSDPSWYQSKFVNRVPRALVFLDLPGHGDVGGDSNERVTAKLIPTAAEFSNGKVETLYRQLTSRDGRQMPPDYPNAPEPLEELLRKRAVYWQWFDENFNATQAMQVIESAAGANGGRIRWIDFRLPTSRNGDTLHLHFSPAEAYDTGSFAYQLVKRGYKHGLRLVGTLKSEPDLNVLAVYEK